MDPKSVDLGSLDLFSWVINRVDAILILGCEKGTRSHFALYIYPGTRGSLCVVRQGLLFCSRQMTGLKQLKSNCVFAGCLSLTNRINYPVLS